MTASEMARALGRRGGRARGKRLSAAERNKSYDRGDRWSAANQGIEGVAVFALAMDQNEPSVLYVTGPEGTFKTTSGGESRRD